MSMIFTRPELELPLRDTGSSSQGSHEFVRATTVIVGPSDTCDFIVTGVADDVQINAAHAYIAGIGGGEILLLEATYVLAAQIVFVVSSTILRGMGRASFINADALATGQHAIVISGLTDCVVKDLAIQTQDGSGNICHCIFIEDGAHRFVVDGVIIVDSAADGIHIEGTSITGGMVFHNTIIDTDSEAIFSDMDGGNNLDYLQVNTNLIQSSGAEGIELNDTRYSRVVNNIIDTTAADGILVAATCDIVDVSGNTILNWTGEPVDNDSATSTVANNNAGGIVLTSKGCSLLTIALAVTFQGAGGWIEVPSGTWSESVTIASSDVLIRGQGWDTIIDGGTTGRALSISGLRCIVRDLTCLTTAGEGNAFDAIYSNGANLFIDHVYISQSDQHGIVVAGAVPKISHCMVMTCDNVGILTGDLSDNAMLTSNHVNTTGDDGIYINALAENCVVTNNVILNWTNEPIDDDSATSTVANNNAGGIVLTSKGCSMATIALAVTYVGASGGWIEVPAGTWNEAVVLNASITFSGQSWDTIINGGTTGHAINVNGADRVTIQNLRVSTTFDATNPFDGINTTGADTTILNVFCVESDRHGFQINGPRARVDHCRITTVNDVGIDLATLGDNSDITGTIIDACGAEGILIDINCEDCVVVANRCIGEAITDNSGTSTVGNNDTT